MEGQLAPYADVIAGLAARPTRPRQNDAHKGEFCKTYLQPISS